MVLYHPIFEEINGIFSGEEAEDILGLSRGLLSPMVSITSDITEYGTMYTVEEVICVTKEYSKIMML